MRAPFSGGCACGAIRWECSEAPAAMVNCHCRDCQRAGGSGYSPTVIVRRESLTLLQGQPAQYAKTADSGETARREFCVACGSPLFASSSARPDFVGIRAGSLDDPSGFAPQVEVWLASAQPWDRPSPDVPGFTRNRTRPVSTP